MTFGPYLLCNVLHKKGIERKTWNIYVCTLQIKTIPFDPCNLNEINKIINEREMLEIDPIPN